jgi:hypothetical protein
MPGSVITKPAVPTVTFKSAAIEFKTPMGKNSLVTSAKAVMETVIIAYQFPAFLGGLGLLLAMGGFSETSRSDAEFMGKVLSNLIK